MCSMKNYALFIAGIVFGIVALAHLSRLIFQFPLIIGTHLLPLWVNGIGLAISAGLCIWMFYSIKEKSTLL